MSVLYRWIRQCCCCCSCFCCKKNDLGENVSRSDFRQISSADAGNALELAAVSEDPSGRSVKGSKDFPRTYLMDVDIDASTFEDSWQRSGKDGTCVWSTVLLADQNPSESAIVETLASERIYCIASGKIVDTQKFYFYAQEVRKVGFRIGTDASLSFSYLT